MADVRQSNTRIQSIIGLLSQGGGAALSNTYKVTFEKTLDGASGRTTNGLFDHLRANVLSTFTESELGGDIVGTSPASFISMFCDEAVMPGVQAATGQVNGIYTGSGQYNYAHTRMYNDLTLSWMCDANMTPLKFLTGWMDYIFQETNETGNEIKSVIGATNQTRVRNRSVRLRYPDEYTLQLSILKAERGTSSETGRPSIRYVLQGCYPYAIDSVPLSFGTSQIMKVTANFYYERWFPIYENQWGPIPNDNYGRTT